MPKTFYITTAIDYTNSPPHIGHAYEKVLADVIARYHRLKGEKVFYLTGVDQHGQKVQQSAAKAGVPPAEFVKGLTKKFVDLWKKLDVKYDGWAETIDPRHKKVVQGMHDFFVARIDRLCTKKSCRECCNGCSMPVKSTKISNPGITRFARNSFSLTRNAARTANLDRSGNRSSFARKKTIISN